MDRATQWILGTEAMLAVLALVAVIVFAIRRIRMRSKEEFEHRDN